MIISISVNNDILDFFSIGSQQFGCIECMDTTEPSLYKMSLQIDIEPIRTDLLIVCSNLFMNLDFNDGKAQILI